MNTIRQSLGVDCSKDTLDVSHSLLNAGFEVNVNACEVFENNSKGFNRLLKWKNKHGLKNLPCQIIIEATGVYHEPLTYWLTEKGMEVVVVLPNKIRNYCRTTDVRTITDKISAKQIAEFGLVKKLDPWQKPDQVYMQLRNLTRERMQLMDEKTIALNQLHAHEHAVVSTPATEKRSKQRIAFIEKQILQIESEIASIINNHSALKTRLEKVCSIKGVGLITAVTMIAETNGFNLIRNSRQLVCYAGYDVISHQSGTSVNTKARISHRGNKYIRRALYFPALTAVQHNKQLGDLYNRLFDKQKIKMKSYVAVQRKLLVIIYTLWNKNECYDPAYLKYLEQPILAALTELD